MFRISHSHLLLLFIVVLLSVLFQEETFLLFYFVAQFLLGGHIRHIFCGKELLAAVEHGVFRDDVVRLGTEQDALMMERK